MPRNTLNDPLEARELMLWMVVDPRSNQALRRLCAADPIVGVPASAPAPASAGVRRAHRRRAPGPAPAGPLAAA